MRIKELSENCTRLVYGIYLENELVGFMNDVEMDEGWVELGYVISPAHKNCGFATEALSALIDEAFRLGFSRVKTGAFSENAASMRVMEKCGMKKSSETEKIEYRGATHDCVYYEKLRNI